MVAAALAAAALAGVAEGDSRVRVAFARAGVAVAPGTAVVLAARVNLVHRGWSQRKTSTAITRIVGPRADVPLHETVAVNDERDGAFAEVAFWVFAIVVLAAVAFALGLRAATLLAEAASAAVKELGGCPELELELVSLAMHNTSYKLVAASLVLLRRLLQSHNLYAAIALAVTERDPEEAFTPVVAAEVAIAVLAASTLVLALATALAALDPVLAGAPAVRSAAARVGPDLATTAAAAAAAITAHLSSRVVGIVDGLATLVMRDPVEKSDSPASIDVGKESARSLPREVWARKGRVAAVGAGAARVDCSPWAAPVEADALSAGRRLSRVCTPCRAAVARSLRVTGGARCSACAVPVYGANAVLVQWVDSAAPVKASHGSGHRADRSSAPGAPRRGRPERVRRASVGRWKGTTHDSLARGTARVVGLDAVAHCNSL